MATLSEFELECNQCGGVWIRRNRGVLPCMCPKCKSVAWNQPKRPKRKIKPYSEWRGAATSQVARSTDLEGVGPRVVGSRVAEPLGLPDDDDYGVPDVPDVPEVEDAKPSRRSKSTPPPGLKASEQSRWLRAHTTR